MRKTCPRCGSTRTYTERIEVPMHDDVPPFPTIDGPTYCLDCEEQDRPRSRRFGVKI